MKALLIVDIDDKYAEKLKDLVIDYYIYSYNEDISEGRGNLKPILEKIEVKTDFYEIGDYNIDDVYATGWNDAIDKISGGEK